MASLSASACFAVSGAASGDWPFAFWSAAGAFAGILITPDLDHDDGSISQHFVRGVSGAAEKVWWLYWYPYRRALAHRSFFSHAPVIGTVIRVFYLFWWLYLAGYGLPPAFVIGLAAADIAHWLMDWRIFSRLLK